MWSRQQVNAKSAPALSAVTHSGLEPVAAENT
jgi:hypothetical protein